MLYLLQLKMRMEALGMFCTQAKQNADLTRAKNEAIRLRAEIDNEAKKGGE